MAKQNLVNTIGLGALACLLSACSSSNPLGGGNPFQSGPSAFDVTFISASETWDLDKDSVVTCAEWQQYALGLHQEADGDGDGQLTEQEYASMARNDRLFHVAKLGYFDANSDGRVSRDELSKKRNRAFEMLDKNNDCKLERDEKVQVRYKQKPKTEDASGESIKGPTGR